MSDIFYCNKCKEPFLSKRNGCCPDVYENIINPEKNYDFTPNHSIGVPKYERTETGAPHDIVLVQYRNLLNKLKVKKGVLLDYGCCYGHASYAVKEYSKDITYIGADVQMTVICNGRDIYPEADFYYKVDMYEEKTLKYLPDNSIDIVVGSRINHWLNAEKFLSEMCRVLKSGGWLMLHGNTDGPTKQHKRYLFELLNGKFNISAEKLSVAIWGNPNAYKKSIDKITEKEAKSRVRFLIQKR